MTRTSSHSSFDGVIDLLPPREVPTHAYALVKLTYSLGLEGCEPIAPEPLFHDLRDETLTPQLLQGSDFWPSKAATDVVVQGSAFSPPGRPARQMMVTVDVGKRRKQIAVFGRRLLEWTSGGMPRIGDAEPFVDMPITYRNAYGGHDGRVEVSAPETREETFRLEMDHPGLYPRNPFGKGYVVLSGRADGVELPNLEDPDDLLTAERLIVGAPELWYRQPLPWCFDWVNFLQFPRFAYLGLNPWFPAPDDERLPEVQRGFLVAHHRTALGETFDPLRPTPPAYYQEASLGMTFEDLSPGTPIVVEGMHPERERIAFTLPQPPQIEIELADRRRRATPQLTSVVIRPAENRVCLVYSALESDLHLTYIPGIHAKIPLAAYVDGTAAIRYETPPTVRALLRQGGG